ncbi:hypothetical protein ACFQY4_16665 [Catellatospora bangladeshensis]|uniref:Uncharacterized protein n=1 Tax=Catellatospora bangladeshensis TaxID=310355 RepID=A0A8J3NLQ1_9ACTN|nr:hypothetical protein [Catellatospora bangladeshensis]GIF84251.1 hypothetical protein Cba03nite_56000 [Catellatospora bangladeshensis]
MRQQLTPGVLIAISAVMLVMGVILMRLHVRGMGVDRTGCGPMFGFTVGVVGVLAGVAWSLLR